MGGNLFFLTKHFQYFLVGCLALQTELDSLTEVTSKYAYLLGCDSEDTFLFACYMCCLKHLDIISITNLGFTCQGSAICTMRQAQTILIFFSPFKCAFLYEQTFISDCCYFS